MFQIATQTVLCPICRSTNRGDAKFCQQCGNDILLDDIYRIIKIIKEGGMGQIYKAVDAAGVEYAIKEMHDRFENQQDRTDGIERFIEEAELLHNLNHPAVPKVYRSFIDEGRYYLSMEFIYGEDLEDTLEREKRFSEPVVLRWADQLCDVLEYMHGAGLIYRDMKPANIMIDRDDNVKLVDFGIAKVLQPGQRHTMVGTPGYSPPEQYQGLATIESDLYALAATLHHLLTGRDPRDHPPFTFPLVTSIDRSISLQTARALEKALEMEAAQRFPSVDAFRRALPIPTGDRRPTAPIDRPSREQAPRAATTARPATPTSAPKVQQSPKPARQAPRPQQQVQQRPRRAGRVLRRVLATAVLAAGVTGAGVVAYPSLEPLVRDFMTSPAAPAPNPATIYSAVQVSAPVTVTLPTGATNQQIRSALREKFIEQAQVDYPGARLNASLLPAVEGNWQASALGDGRWEYTAQMSGSIDVPQPAP